MINENIILLNLWKNIALLTVKNANLLKFFLKQYSEACITFRARICLKLSYII